MKNTGSPFIDGLLCAGHLPSRNLSSEQGTLTSKQMTLRDGSEFCSGRRAIEQHMQRGGVGQGSAGREAQSWDCTKVQGSQAKKGKGKVSTVTTERQAGAKG